MQIGQLLQSCQPYGGLDLPWATDWRSWPVRKDSWTPEPHSSRHREGQCACFGEVQSPKALLCSATLTLTKNQAPGTSCMPVMSGFHGTQGGNYRV